jgi:hypothetical protein
MPVIKLTPTEGKANPCVFHPNRPSVVVVVRKVAENAWLCSLCNSTGVR